MPSMTLFEGGLAPANDSAVVNKSITVPSWWLTWQQKKIIQLRKHTCKKNTLCRLVHSLSPYLTQGNSKGEGRLESPKFSKETMKKLEFLLKQGLNDSKGMMGGVKQFECNSKAKGDLHTHAFCSKVGR